MLFRSVEIDYKGQMFSMRYDKPIGNGQTVDVANIHVAADGTLRVEPLLQVETVAQKLWNIDTQKFQRVNLITHSPNFWDDQRIGNEHVFFMLDGCANDGTARGFYNEMLRSDLDQHRKVLEMVGSRMRTDETTEQLSGLGFSLSQRNSLILNIKGAMQRHLKVEF